MAHIIGEPIDRIDGNAKVTGKAVYAADGKRRDWRSARSPRHDRPWRDQDHRRQRSATPAGVLMIMTHENARRGAVVPKTDDPFARPKPQLDSRKIQYFGQPVALVVADSFEAAREAANLIEVTYVENKGAFDLAASDNEIREPKQDGVGKAASSRIGDIDTAMRTAAVTVDETYKTPYQNHNMMEPHASTAEWDGEKLTVRSAVQLVGPAHQCIATTLKLPAPIRSR